jgi:hypothetical protein
MLKSDLVQTDKHSIKIWRRRKNLRFLRRTNHNTKPSDCLKTFLFLITLLTTFPGWFWFFLALLVSSCYEIYYRKRS